MSNDTDLTTQYENLIKDLAKSHIEGIRRGYKQGYLDGRRDEQKKMDPVVSDGTRHGSPLSASELGKRRKRG